MSYQSAAIPYFVTTERSKADLNSQQLKNFGLPLRTLETVFPMTYISKFLGGGGGGRVYIRTHEKNSGKTVRRLGTIIQSIFCAQSGAGIRLNFWKEFDESRYPGALSPVLENVRPAFSPDPTDCPWVSKDGVCTKEKGIK